MNRIILTATNIFFHSYLLLEDRHYIFPNILAVDCIFPCLSVFCKIPSTYRSGVSDFWEDTGGVLHGAINYFWDGVHSRYLSRAPLSQIFGTAVLVYCYRVIVYLYCKYTAAGAQNHKKSWALRSSGMQKKENAILAALNTYWKKPRFGSCLVPATSPFFSPLFYPRPMWDMNRSFTGVYLEIPSENNSPSPHLCTSPQATNVLSRIDLCIRWPN